MRFLDTTYKQKSALLTFLIMSALIASLFFIGLSYIYPPEEFGIALNFGTSDVGMGNEQPKAPGEISTPLEKDQVEQKQQEETFIKTRETSENVLTQNTEEPIVIKNKLEVKKKAEEAKKILAEQKRIEAQKAQEAQKKQKLDALINGLNNSEGNGKGNEGDDNVAGDKGGINGDVNAKGYYETGENGNGDYNLGNRSPLYKPKPDYICNEEGLVVVRIEVDVNGNVTKATAGVKGSTNTAQCLLSQAEKAALQTKWQPDKSATSKQVGTIKYRFSLSQ